MYKVSEVMDRLTKWNGNKWVLPQGRTSEGESYWRIIAERLAQYEDIGLSPCELEEIVKERKSRKEGRSYE